MSTAKTPKTVSGANGSFPDDLPPVWVIDLDGVIWRGPAAIPGSAEAIGRLQAAGYTVVFATNNASLTPEAFESRLADHGIASGGNVVTSSQATATMISPGERVYVIGRAGLRQALTDAGAELIEDPPGELAAGRSIDAVACGITPEFNYAMLRAATRAVLSGARLIASNTDSSFPAADGIDPGNGSLVAAIETATGRKAEVAGKPCAPMAALVKQRWGSRGICVGDRPETDGEFAVELGYDFALVLSGVTTAGDQPVTPQPTVVADDLAALVDAAIGLSSAR